MHLAELVPHYTQHPISMTPYRAVHVLVQSNLRREGRHRCSARGKGNKAAKREAFVRTISMSPTERQLREVFSGITHMGLTATEVDRLAEQWTEARALKPRRNAPHL